MLHDPVWIDILLAIHVTAGMTCLVLAPLALAVVKGSRAHRRWGKLYFLSICVMTATALAVALYRPAFFLALLAVLSFYLAFSGYRVLSLKRPASGGSASFADWAAALIATGASAMLAGLGLLPFGPAQHISVVPVVLGLLGMRAGLGDLYRFARRPTGRLYWLNVHLSHFIASYIAALTAFSVVTLSRLLPHAGLVVWLWPATLGVPLILVAGAYYQRKFAAAI
jgi:hypothetical protein